jgi:hypothetical protein
MGRIMNNNDSVPSSKVEAKPIIASKKVGENAKPFSNESKVIKPIITPKNTKQQVIKTPTVKSPTQTAKKPVSIQDRAKKEGLPESVIEMR